MVALRGAAEANANNVQVPNIDTDDEDSGIEG